MRSGLDSFINLTGGFVIMRKSSCIRWCLVIVIALFALAALGLAAEKGYKVHGYIYSATSPSATAAQGVNVVLINKATGATVDSATTGWTGGYKFKDVPPGTYVLKLDKFSRDITVVKKNVRSDFDLSQPDGAYSPGKMFMEGLSKSVAAAAAGESGGLAPDVGPSDPDLMRAMAGEYYSYSGSTERSVTLCTNGTFFGSSESSYSGTSSDSLGNQTGAWGAANQKQSGGNWSVQGSLQGGTITLGYRGGKTEKVPYQTTGERGCFRFNGTPFCYRSAGRCQ
jgi:hypothetical protein